MSVSADEVAAHGDEDHGVRNVEAFFIVSYEAASSGVTFIKPNVRISRIRLSDWFLDGAFR